MSAKGKLAEGLLKTALKALKDIGANADEVIAARAGGTLDDIFEQAAKAAGRQTKPLIRPMVGVDLRKGLRQVDIPGEYSFYDEVGDAAKVPRRGITGGTAEDFFNRVETRYDPLVNALRLREAFPLENALSGTAMARLANERPAAVEVLKAVQRGAPRLSMARQYDPGALLVANQVARKGGTELAGQVAARTSLDDPLRATNAILKEGLNDTQKEMLLTFLQDGMGLDDALNVVKALA